MCNHAGIIEGTYILVALIKAQKDGWEETLRTPTAMRSPFCLLPSFGLRAQEAARGSCMGVFCSHTADPVSVLTKPPTQAERSIYFLF